MTKGHKSGTASKGYEHAACSRAHVLRQDQGHARVPDAETKDAPEYTKAAADQGRTVSYQHAVTVML